MMMTEISLLSSSELAQVMPIENACHVFPTSEKLLASCFSKRYHNEKLTLDGRIVGFYLAELVVDEFTLHNICIHPDAQGKGLGKLLFNRFIDKAESLGAVQLWLEVRESNKSAIGLYEQQGFCVAGTRRDYYPAKNGREDALLMGLSLGM